MDYQVLPQSWNIFSGTAKTQYSSIRNRFLSFEDDQVLWSNHTRSSVFPHINLIDFNWYRDCRVRLNEELQNL